MDKVEIIQPNKELTELVKLVVEQNQVIVQMNAIIVRSISNPVIHVPTANKKEGEVKDG